jgi:hypothetical protein
LLLFVVIVTTEVNAQFDTIVFSKEGYFLYESIIYMGDQDSDGYDDFMITLSETPNPMDARAYFFKGGNPLIRMLRFLFPFYIREQLLLVIGTGMVSEILLRFTIRNPNWIKFLVYFGGSAFDTIPDHIFILHFRILMTICYG